MMGSFIHIMFVSCVIETEALIALLAVVIPTGLNILALLWINASEMNYNPVRWRHDLRSLFSVVLLITNWDGSVHSLARL